MNRRRFLLLLGEGATGIFLASSGFIRLPEGMVLSYAGRCSFCNRSGKETRAFAGVSGMPTKICSECIALCLELIREEDYAVEESAAASWDTILDVVDIEFETDAEEEAYFRRLLADSVSPADIDLFLDSLRSPRKPPPPPPPETPKEGAASYNCTFCGASQKQVRKLIAGPAVYICDSCIGEAAVLLNSSGTLRL